MKQEAARHVHPSGGGTVNYVTMRGRTVMEEALMAYLAQRRIT